MLIVEDYLQIRRWTALALTRAGYEVIGAEDGETALRQLEATEARVDLALVDWTLPGGLDGEALLDELGQRHPRLPVIVASGLALSPLELARPNVVGCLKKPFDQEELRRAVDGVLRANDRLDEPDEQPPDERRRYLERVLEQMKQDCALEDAGRSRWAG